MKVSTPTNPCFGYLQCSTKILAALTFILVISPCPCATFEERFLQIPALKRVAQLGYLYNEKTDSFINANVFRGTIPKEFITEIQIPDSRTYTGITDSLIDNFNFFSIDKNTAVNILAGITNPEGALSLINQGQCSTLSQIMTGSLLYKYKTVVENLESFHDKLKDNYNTDIVEHVQATHVVTTITWGSQVAVQLQLKPNNSNDTKNESRIRISRNLLRAELRSLRRGEQTASASNLSMTVTSDIPLPLEFPTTGQEVKEILNQVPNLVGDLNGGKGIPLGYTLTPINLIRSHLGLDQQNTSAVKLNEFTLNELIDVFQELHSAEMELHQLNERIASYSKCIPQETGIELIDFQSKLRSFKTNFTTAVKHSLIQVRSGLSENTVLTDLVVGFTKSDFERENLRRQVANNFDLNGNEIECNFPLCKNINETSVFSQFKNGNISAELETNTETDCAHPGTCNFVVKKPTSTCKCREGYVKNARDPAKCQSSTSDNATLLFGTPRGIQQYSIGQSKMTLLNFETTLHRALDFHYRTQTMFWGGTDQKIYSAPIHAGSSKTLVLTVPGSNIHSIAIDWVHDHLYIADKGENKIFVVNLDGSMKKVVIHDGLDHPTSIVVNPVNGWMYWVDWGKKRIERAGMDGSGRQVIATTPYDHPNGLALDYTENRLYWTTYSPHPCLILSMNPDGSDQRIVLRAAGGPFTGTGSQFWYITIFENLMYWRDHTTGKMYRANKCNGEGVTELISDSQHHRSVQAYHFSKQPQVQNQCANRILQCSHLCLPIPGIGNETLSTICACPDGRTLSYDRHTCL